MLNSCDIPHPLKRNGTSQNDRFPDALREDYVKIDERTAMDLLKASAEYAAYINYYQQNDVDTPADDWKSFFTEIYNYATSGEGTINEKALKQLEAKQSVKPHLSLLITFIKLFGHAQDNLNALTYRHLNFFYRDVLRLEERPPVSDRAIVTFELEKSRDDIFIPAGIALKAGKDSTGNEMYYYTKDELIVNRGKIEELKSAYVKKNKFTNVVEGIYASPIANSADGNGAKVETNPKAWKGFGITQNDVANIGFAVSSPLFCLNDGKRKITFVLPGLNTGWNGTFKVEYTGPKGWVKANAYISSNNYLVVKIPKSSPAVVLYNKDIHKGNYNAVYPILRFVLIGNYIDNNIQYSYQYSNFKSIIINNTAKIVVSVLGTRDFVIQNDSGVLDTAKPFQPFGNLPVKNKSSFYIVAQQIFNKNLRSLYFGLDWKGRPETFTGYYNGVTAQLIKSYYQEYIDAGLLKKESFMDFRHAYFPGKFSILDDGKWKDISPSYDEQAKLQMINSLYQMLNTLNNSGYSPLLIFLYTILIYIYIFYLDSLKTPRFQTYQPQANQLVSVNESAANEPYGVDSKIGVGRFILNKDFGHSYYQNLLTSRALKKIKATNPDDVSLPNAPYTPELKSISIDYTAEDTINLSGDTTESTFYHLHPFGEELITVTGNTSILPEYSDEGYIYLGISGISEAKTVSIYFNMLDGSGNRELTKTSDVKWEYLEGNQFIEFNRLDILKDTTNLFTNSGIIKFAIKKSTISNHTVLTDNLVWIRGKVETNREVFPMLIDITTQAVEVEFKDTNNSPTHLASPLPALSISKFDVKIPGVKSVTQPNQSYNGKMAEESTNFYRRISERLRHKNRGVTMWDYERLVLENFPSVHKAKCISHSDLVSEYAPGSVHLIVVPDTTNIIDTDLLKPCVSQSDLTLIAQFVSKLISSFVSVSVSNPVYEQLEVTVTVKLKDEYKDVAYYNNELKKAITGFFSPWLSKGNKGVNFEQRIYKSQIIDFIDEQEYVEYITDLSVSKYIGEQKILCKEEISGSNESVILTSYITHNVYNGEC